MTTSYALLETLVGRRNAEEQPVRRWSQRGYDIRRADLEGYQNALQERVANLNMADTRRNTLMKALELQKAIHNAASGNIGRKSGIRRDRAVCWWTPTLTDLKKMSYNARRDYQNSDQPP